MNTKTLTKISVLAVIAYTLSWFEFPLPIFPVFLKIDISDLPVIIGTLMLGALPGIFIALIKNILHGIFQSTSGGVGEVANFIIGISYALPFWFIFKNKRDFKRFAIGAAAGIFCMSIAACALNYIVLIPLYCKILGVSIEDIVKMAQAVSSSVVSFKTLILYSILPFNILKGIIVTFVTALLFKALKPVFFKN